MRSRTAWYRARVESLMPDTAQINTRTVVRNAEGEEVEVWTTALVPCRLEVSQHVPLEQQQAATVAGVSIWNLYVPVGTRVRPRDTVTVNGVSYEVSDRADAQTDGVTEMVTLRRVT